MLAGKTIVSEKVFLNLAKETLSQITNVEVQTQSHSTFESITKLITDKISKKNKAENEVLYKADIIVSDIQMSVIHQTNESEPPPTISFNLVISCQKDVTDLIVLIRQKIKQEVETITGYKVQTIDFNINNFNK